MAEPTFGLAGTLLRVDLTTGAIRREATPVELFRQYLGGRGVGAHMLFHEVPAGADPLGPVNKLIFLTGPLAGTLAPGANKISATFRSPLSNTYSFSLCGGHLAPELRFAGYDGIVVEGVSPRPVYLYLTNGRAELRDGSALWGKLTHDTEDAVRADLNEPDARVACIGPAGEKLVRFACIQSDYFREFGRGGGGAVMGAKRLKAIAVRGSGSVPVADAPGLARIAEGMYADFAKHPKARARRQYGTNEMVESTNGFGYWATRNFSTGHFEQADRLTGVRLKEEVYQGDNSCFGCPIACGKISPVRRGQFAGDSIEGSEFETLGLLGPNCGISNPETIVAATAICDAYGMDTMSAGVVASLAMECAERGIPISSAEGMDLHFGSENGLLALLHQMGARQGLGDLLAEGSRRAAERLGVPDLAMQSKGMELATYEPRGVVGMGLTYAISPKGAHHMIAPTMGAEIAGDPSRRLRSDGKAALVKDTTFIMAIVDSLSLCASMRFVLGLKPMLSMVTAVTGRQISEEEALHIAERIVNLERLYNMRDGFRRRDDTLPPRLTTEPMPSGPSQGNLVPLAAMLDEYYSLMHWDNDGVPTREQAGALGLEAEWQDAVGSGLRATGTPCPP